MKLPDEQAARRARFMAACKGLTAWQVSKVVGRFSSGVNWGGCSKGHMADAYALGPDRSPRVYDSVIAALEAAPRKCPNCRRPFTFWNEHWHCTAPSCPLFVCEKLTK